MRADRAGWRSQRNRRGNRLRRAAVEGSRQGDRRSLAWQGTDEWQQLAGILGALFDPTDATFDEGDVVLRRRMLGEQLLGPAGVQFARDVAGEELEPDHS